MCGIEQGVARRKGQPVIAAHDPALDDFERKARLGDHRLHHGDLLEILLAEIGTRRLHHGEELAHHLRHAVEMARTGGALHHLVDPAEIVLPEIGDGVHLLDRGHEDHVGPRRFEQRAIGFGRARIVSQIVFIVELRGIDEHAHHDGGVLAARPFDERTVAGMQGTHGRDQPDTGRIDRREHLAKRFDACYGFHYYFQTIRPEGSAKLEITIKI